MNAVLGELLAILDLNNIEPLESGDAPEDHQQISGLLEARYLRVLIAGDYPSQATTNDILIDPNLIDQGEYPFRIYRNGAWETPDSPLAEGGGDDPDQIEPDAFTDASHGQRGGGSLHSLATTSSAGFMSAQAVQALTNVIDTAPNVYRSDWQSIEATNIKVFPHNFGAEPDQVSILFRDSDQGRVRVLRNFFDNTGNFSGVSVYDVTDTEIRVAAGDWVWSGYSDIGLEQFDAGQIKVTAIAYGA